MATFDLAAHAQIMIEAPPEAIWPWVINPQQLRDNAEDVHVSGPLGEVGEVMRRRVIFEGEAYEMRIKLIALEPLRRRVVLIDREGEIAVAYGAMTLFPLCEWTLVSYDVYAELESDIMDEADVLSLKLDYGAQQQRLIMKDLQRMKELAEKDYQGGAVSK